MARVRAALARMPARRRFSDDDSQPWSGMLHASLYVSVVHTEGLSAFLRGKRARGPSELWAYSPYWSDVADLVREFDARETVLVPARRADGRGLGLSREQAEEIDEGIEIRRNEEDFGDRFWHMKAYWIRQGEGIRTAVGSCNFTRGGLSGRNGNVEAMLVFDGGPEWLTDGKEIKDDDLAEEAEAGRAGAASPRLARGHSWGGASRANPAGRRRAGAAGRSAVGASSPTSPPKGLVSSGSHARVGVRADQRERC